VFGTPDEKLALVFDLLLDARYHWGGVGRNSTNCGTCI